MAEKRKLKSSAPKSDSGFTAEEQAAARARVREMRARSRGTKVDGEAEVRAAIAAMAPADRAIAQRFHALMRTHAPALTPRTWYGMPAYSKGDQVLCWIQNAGKFKVRYSSVGFSDEAHLDDGHMWPIAYALTELTDVEEAKIVALVKRALG